jgi:hypothetical protein
VNRQQRLDLRDSGDEQKGREREEETRPPPLRWTTAARRGLRGRRRCLDRGGHSSLNRCGCGCTG